MTIEERENYYRYMDDAATANRPRIQCQSKGCDNIFDYDKAFELPEKSYVITVCEDCLVNALLDAIGKAVYRKYPVLL